MAIPFTPYPYIDPRSLRPSRASEAATGIQDAIQQFVTARQQQSTLDMAKQQKIIDFAKAADEGGQDFIDRFKALVDSFQGKPPITAAQDSGITSFTETPRRLSLTLHRLL
jgi:hypothetical protein